MSAATGTIPEPTEVIKARNGLPPKSRSPIKTNLGSAARRSLGPMSSPSRHPDNHNETPTHRAMSHPPNRRLDFSMTEDHSSVKSSTNKGKLPATKGSKFKPTPLAGKRKRGPFDLEPTPDQEPFDEEADLANGNAPPADDDYDEDLNYGGMDESLHLTNGDAPNLAAQDQDTISPVVEKEIVKAAVKAKRNPGKTAASKILQAEVTNTTPSSGRRGRPPKKPKVDVPAEDPAEEPVEEPVQESVEDPVEETVEDPVGEPVEETVEEPAQPQKRPGRGKKAAMQPPATKPGRGKKALNLKDPNTRLEPPKTTRRASSVQPKGSMSPTKTRFIERSETPGDDLHFHTRAGRNVVKPLAFWRGEAAVFSPGRIEEGHRILPSITKVIRKDEVPEPRRRRTPGQPRKRRSKPVKREEDDELPEDDDDEGEYWETEGGVMQASVMLWDPETGRGDEENLETAGECSPIAPPGICTIDFFVDVAYAAEAIEMRDIGGADFRFAKTLTLPFFGSGMVDLPPGGTKRIKNSRKMQMVFFVFYGRVLVELGTPTQRFSIGRGGMWQVPRGELPFFHGRCCSHIGFTIIAPPNILAILDPASLDKRQEVPSPVDIISPFIPSLFALRRLHSGCLCISYPLNFQTLY